ncbi:MAG: diaminopimelate epimerase [Candidatus Bathyarchaeia archaeon]|nr:diaminopimelate epimerase [Candidatus Bathyarchaeota archaeon]
MKFWKMHGLGNDYIVIDDRKELIKNPEEKARKLCRRRFSIGADGLILLQNPVYNDADLKMRIFNKDGSEAEMCGNGIRCAAKFCYEAGISKKEELNIETKAGLRKVWLKIEDKKVKEVKVNMGKPIFERKLIPVLGEGTFINEEIKVGDNVFQATCVSMGNPHCVIFVNNLEKFPVRELGPKIETYPLFPNRMNVEFVEVLNKNVLKVRVWERGCGETLACGTGACASAVISNLLNKTNKEVLVKLKGGELKIKVNNEVLMSGPVAKVFEGKIEL